MEEPIRANKPNIRTKCCRTRLTPSPLVVADVVAHFGRSTRSVATIVGLVLLLLLTTPSSAVAKDTPPSSSSSSPPASSSPSSSAASSAASIARVLDIDAAHSLIHIQLEHDAPAVDDDDDANTSVWPTVSASDCHQADDGDQQPLLAAKRSHDGRKLTVSYAAVQFGASSGDQADEGYLCVGRRTAGGVSQHLGESSRFSVARTSGRSARDVPFEQVHNEAATAHEANAASAAAEIRLDGIRVEGSERAVTYTDEGVPEVMGASRVTFRLFGSGFTNRTIVTLTEEATMYGGGCMLPATGGFAIVAGSLSNNTVLVEVLMPRGHTFFYFCTKEADDDDSRALARKIHPFVHQGSAAWLRTRAYENLLPIWAAICIIVGCLMFSALFSGLNLGLMSLDRTELKILKSTGTGKEREYAAKIQPIRDHGNYLLCAILLGNVLVNSTFTIILDGLTSGLIAVVFSTLLIVVFGEITPQAVCSRHGLAVGANTIWITKAVMVLTFPLAYPTSRLLDWALGEEIGAVYNRERLKELVRVTKDVNDLDKDEVNIISGALELRKKTVADVMTHIEDTFMLSYDAVLDFETVSEIMKSGFSRIPVYEGDRQNVLTLLFIKDLAFVDPDDNTPLRTLCEFYQNSCHFVFEDVTLDVMFRRFKEGHRGHMAFVHRVNSSGDGDPFYETVGLITLEDVIEELIQAEIVDETDVYTDNRTKVRRNRTKKHDFTIFAERRENHHIRISPQLTLATYQYLTTSVDAFKSDIVSETILRRLLNQDVMHQIRCKGKEKDDPSMVIYQQGKPVDYFVLILEGRVEVTVGRESLIFESGPFTYFGTQALVQNVGVVDSPQAIKGSLQSLNMDAMLRHTFVPDYSVKAITEVFYIAIKRTLYLAAKRATLMERAQKLGEQPVNNEPIDEEVEKLMHSLDGDDHSINTHTANLNVHTPRASKSASHQTSPSEALNNVERNGSLPTGVDGSAAAAAAVAALQQRKSIGGGGGDESAAPLLPK